MGKPIIRSGKFEAGSGLQCGENVVIEVAEEVRVGDRCVLSDNAYFGGRRITLGDDFFGYSWCHPCPATPGFSHSHGPLTHGRWLEVGRGRRDEADAILTVGSRCTFHDNRIDLARRVTIGDDVGLSPEVAIYTHGYWQSVLEGFPATFKPVVIGDNTIIGFRAVLLPGTDVGRKSVIGAGSVVAGKLEPWGVYGGNPAKLLREVERPSREKQEIMLREIVAEYIRSCVYRAIGAPHRVTYPVVELFGCCFDVEALTVTGEEDERSDDFRWFLFTRGVRIYTKRPFRKLGKRV